MKIKLTAQNWYEYHEVWEILEWKDGCHFRVETTGKFIWKPKENWLDKQKYTTSSISTTLTNQMRKEGFVEVELWEI